MVKDIFIVREVDEIGNSVDRPMTEDEIALWQAANEIAKNERLANEKITQNKASALAKLAALGLTEDEIAAL